MANLKTKIELYLIANSKTWDNKKEANNVIIKTRKTSYGSWENQLDEIYTDIDAWKTRIAKVKSDNPKE